MNLTAPNIVHYLLHRRLVDVGSVVDGHFAVNDSVSRHHSFRVTRGPHRGYFLKQPLHDGPPDASGALHREGRWCEAVNSVTELASIRSLMPGFYEFDEARSVLTTELLTSFNLLEYHQEVGQYPVAIGTALGDALAAVHSIDIDHIEPMLPSGLLRRKPPYALWRPWSNPAAVPFRATTEQYIASRPELCIELERIRDDMRSNSLIHADVKLDNITFTEAADGTIKIKLLDWELVDRGDAARDAGSVISNYVALAILRSTTKGNVSRADPTQQRLELAAVRPLLTAFWKRYARNRGFKSEESHRELVRCMRFAAARMIETACQNDASHPFCGLLIEAVEVILLDTQRAITLVVET